MTIWFAQNSSVNIDSVNQWNGAANGSGAWLTWASLNAADVLVANGKTNITCNVSFTCAEIRTLLLGSGASGGTFLLGEGVTITANILAGTTNCLTRSAAGATSYIVGNLTGSAATSSISAVVVSSGAGGLTVTGNLQGGGGSSYGLAAAGTGAIAITGNVTGGPSSSAHGVWTTSTGPFTVTGTVTGGGFNTASGVYNAGGGTITIIGDCVGGSNNDCCGAYNNSSGTINITGNVIGGTSSTVVYSSDGVRLQSTGPVTVTGNAVGGPGAGGCGARNLGTGLLTINGNATGGTGGIGVYNSNVGTVNILGIAIGNDHGLGYSTNIGTVGVAGYGVNTGVVQATTTVRGIKYGAKGQSPTAGLVQLDVGYLTGSYAGFVGKPTDFTQYTFGPQEYIGGQPSEANVRSGTNYNFGLRTGTLMIPSPTLVAIGVATDNTVGSYNPAAAVWDRVRTSSNTPGTFGAVREWAGNQIPLVRNKAFYTTPGGLRSLRNVTIEDLGNGFNNLLTLAPPYRNLALGNAAVAVKESTAKVYGWTIVNDTDDICYLRFYSSASAPTVGVTTPYRSIPYGPQQIGEVPVTDIPQFQTPQKLWVCVVKGNPDTGNTALSKTVFIEILYL